MELPSPPDGAPIAGLDQRRHWLGLVEIAYRLPAEGLLFVGPEFTVSLDATSLTARAGDEERTRPLAADEHDQLVAIWTDLWSAGPSDSPSVFLLYRGVFRTVGAPDDHELAAWIEELVQA